MPKAAIYCRLSSEDRDKKCATDDSNSIKNQKSMLAEYAIQQDWDIYDIYSDDNYTGSDRDRPEFNRILADAEAHKFDIILCKSQSRFTREIELVEKYIHGCFPVWGIRFVSLVDHADTAVQENKKSRQLNAFMNEWYLEDMSANIRSALTTRRIQGLHIGAFAPYGYAKDPEKKGHLIIDEQAAAVVREIFILFSQGHGKTSIARMLNERGIPNPTEYKRQNGFRFKQPESKSSTLWRDYSITHILTNEVYIGNMVQGRYGSISYKSKMNKPRPKDQWFRAEGTHEPIIDRDLWDRVQAQIQAKTKPFKIGTVGLFARKARCINCGRIMRSSKTSDGRYYLKCSIHHVSENACIGSFISVKRLERYVVDELNKLSQQYLDEDTLEQNVQLNQDLEQRIHSLQNTKNKLLGQLEKNKKYLTALYMDKVEGVITQADYLDMKGTFSEKNENIQNQIEDADRHIAILQQRILEGDQRRALIQQYTNVTHLTREMVEILIDYISVGKRIPGTHDVPIEIHWNF